MFKLAKLCWQALFGLVENDGMELAGHIAYTALLSLFPFIIFLTSLAGIYSDTQTVSHTLSLLFALVPPEIAHVLLPVIEDIIGQAHGGILTFGILVTLWVTTGGVETLRLGLNRAYHVKETRAWWLRRLQGLAYVFMLAVLMLLLSVAIILAPLFTNMAARWINLPDSLQLLWDAARYLLVAVALTVAFGLIYATLPNLRQKRRAVLPGAVAATFLWLLLAGLFSLYVTHFSSYSVTYGSLSGIIITMFFLNLSAVIFLFGAELNYVLHRSAEPATSPPAPVLHSAPQY